MNSRSAVSACTACSSRRRATAVRDHQFARHVVGEGHAPGVRRIGLFEMLDQGDRDIVDLEPHRRLGMHAEGMAEGGADRAAMRRRHDVAAAMLGRDLLDARHRALAEIDEALAAGRPELRRSQPEQMIVGVVLGDLDIGEPLPRAEMLLGEGGIDPGVIPPTSA